MSVSDLRGSKHQHYLFDMLSAHYGQSNIIWELVLPNGLRIDIFVKHLGIAVEYDGEQHYKFNEHFHGDINGYISHIARDEKKEEFLKANGIKLVRFRGDVMDLTLDQVLSVIEDMDYPDTEYDFYSLSKRITSKDDINKKAKEYRKQQYQKMKKESKSYDN